LYVEIYRDGFNDQKVQILTFEFLPIAREDKSRAVTTSKPMSWVKAAEVRESNAPVVRRNWWQLLIWIEWARVIVEVLYAVSIELILLCRTSDARASCESE